MSWKRPAGPTTTPRLNRTCGRVSICLVEKEEETSSHTHAHADKHKYTYLTPLASLAMVDLSIYCTVHHLKVISISAKRFFFFRGIFVIVGSGDASFGSELSSLWSASITKWRAYESSIVFLGVYYKSSSPRWIQTTVLTVSISHGEEDIMECVHLCMCVFADTALWLANLHAGGGVLKDLVALIGCFALSTRPRSSHFSSVAFILV